MPLNKGGRSFFCTDLLRPRCCCVLTDPDKNAQGLSFGSSFPSLPISTKERFRQLIVCANDLLGYSPAVQACPSPNLHGWSERTWDSCGAEVLAVKVPLVLFPKTSFPEMRICLGIYKKNSSSFPWQHFPFHFSNQNNKIISPSSLIPSLPDFQFTWSLIDLWNVKLKESIHFLPTLFVSWE